MSTSLAVAFWSRLTVLSHSMWHDEIVTIEQYVLSGPTAIFFADYIPNNHMLFSVLAWASGELITPTEAVWRLWSGLPGTAAIAVLAAALWRWVSPWAAAVAAVLLTISPLHHVLTPQARGYGLAFLAASGMVAGALAVSEHPKAGIAAFAISGWLGIATLPVMVLPFLGHALALSIRPALRRPAAVAVAGTGVASLLWYLPVLQDLMAQTGQEFGERLPWHGPITGIRFLTSPWFGMVRAEVSQPLQTVAAVVLAGGAAWLLWRRDRLLLADFAVPVVFTLSVVTAAQLHVADRFLSALLVPLVALMAAGAMSPLEQLGERIRRLAAIPLAIASLALLLIFARYANDVNRLPLENFRGAAEAVSDFDIVFATSARPTGLQYYVGERLRGVSPEDVGPVVCGAEPPIAYIEHPFLADPVDTTCLVELDATVVDVRQRTRGGGLRVWLRHAEDEGSEAARR